MAAATTKHAFFALGLFLVSPAWADGYYTVGVEGFRDRYREPGPDVNEHADYGSVTAAYKYSWSNGVFATTENRASYGKDDYKSPDGTINGIPQYEFESRVIAGMRLPFLRGTVNPYVGLGARFYYDNSKGEVTSLGLFGYDRRILQFYAPIGLTYKFSYGDWIFAPTLEADPLLLGKVNTRLRNVGANYDNVTNTQQEGFGARGEFMFGQVMDSYAWQAGPFVRYWKVDDSNLQSGRLNGVPSQLYEPTNDRLQMGAALKVSF